MPRSVAAHRGAVVELLTRQAARKGTEELPLLDAIGRALAADLRAPVSLPPFANSQMDGFAVFSADIPDGGAELRVGAPVPAGARPAALERGFAVPIMTGAMLPKGADAVVPIERAVPSVFPAAGAVDALVRLPATAPGTFVRDAGSDIAEGALALAAGTSLGPAQLGLLAALGLTSVEVRSPLRVLLVTTGDEVVEPGNPLVTGKIYDSNGTLLEASMRQAGLEVVRNGISDDDPAGLLDVLRKHTDNGSAVDLVVTTGGVSKGAYEVVRQAMAGEDVEFVPVAMQPGGPQGIGTFNDVPFLGFPGNPVSCLVSFEMFLRPALSEVLGAPRPRQMLPARLAEPLTSPKGKHQVRRGIIENGVVRLEGGAGSHLVHALARSNALIQVPADVTELQAGDEVEVWVL
ncbi:molybdopterin molybdotransferase MoeA [Arthrobacter sp. TES]|uniref:Molybdopterin molybdenumtransferase n=1 Tax=Paenarthrobacter ureafaciens TaxID=37931 RepID=A0AAX3ENS6_PAEUR|nr:MULTISPECIES: gephyrin-like molybdotransferase Glp [Paenarthrobacter]AMB39968.1 molybdenum cofactor biosynthesis protein MoaA [Arthrobacter sp. ATCC 21022]NKR12084.1 molybdopterin molybdenumtransferase MoeA [Arthrobacter sp. M5]NKR18180.1 molybdopterin molybdenumtransferase MoeA [Arthrobacter sp. M6]OEH57357.1 molybdopterin molybdenumtransferase MoeA [Arthrobacter sp. D2]OEH65005.1 molybdopterin molybdenumtransferase MoeA [Arthrobacter sp. D4]QOI63734.1 molybdopterin molybdotransferase Moe